MNFNYIAGAGDNETWPINTGHPLDPRTVVSDDDEEKSGLLAVAEAVESRIASIIKDLNDPEFTAANTYAKFLDARDELLTCFPLEKK